MTPGRHGFVADDRDRGDRTDHSDRSDRDGRPARGRSGMLGTDENRDLVDWRKREIDGATVYELEYSDPVPDLQGGPPAPTAFAAGSGGTVPTREQEIELPDGERIPAREATFEAEGTTLRVRRESPSVLARVRRVLPW